MSSLYNIRTERRTLFRCVKFTSDLELECIYYLRYHPRTDTFSCTCPVRGFNPCRHRRMARIFFLSSRVDTGWFYDYDAQKWVPPLEKRIKRR